MPQPRPRRQNKQRSTRSSKRSRRSRTGIGSMDIVSVRKDFEIFPSSKTGVGSSAWLDALKFFAVIVAKIILAVTTLTADTVTYPLAMVQVIYISAEDLLSRHKFCYTDSGTKRKILPFDEAKVVSIKATLSCTAKTMDKCGRMMLAILPVTETEAVSVLKDPSQVVVPSDFLGPSLTDQKFKCAVGSASRSISTSFRPTGYNASYYRIGDPAPGNSKTIPLGGQPVFKVFIGYQNLSTNGTLDETYSPENASFNLSLSGRILTKGASPVAIREVPIWSRTDQVRLICNDQTYDVSWDCVEDDKLTAAIDDQSQIIAQQLHDYVME